MDIQRDKIIPVFIEEETKDSYIDYSMSVIASLAAGCARRLEARAPARVAWLKRTNLKFGE